MSQELTLPWPDKVLSPNGRYHWVVKSRAVKAYRMTCWALALEAKLKAPAEGPIDVYLTFRPPSNRHFDQDGLISRMKSGLDGLADALGVNDQRFRIKPVMGTPCPPGAVWVSIARGA